VRWARARRSAAKLTVRPDLCSSRQQRRDHAMSPPCPSTLRETRTAERPVTVPVGGALIWRTADNPARREAVSGGVAMGTDAGDRKSVAAAAEPTPPASPNLSGAAACAAPPSLPDMNRLVDDVMRLVVRRIHIERERRGGKLWN
jgi:hypothetical protein